MAPAGDTLTDFPILEAQGGLSFPEDSPFHL